MWFTVSLYVQEAEKERDEEKEEGIVLKKREDMKG